MIARKLAAKARTTIPGPVRAALRLEPGEEIACEMVDGRVHISTFRQGDISRVPFPFAGTG
jgi:bifunctional DNA-binding transcriptional regulator/antitoxin component of YhaV-PrlF toxin-antitoxin module